MKINSAPTHCRPLWNFSWAPSPTNTQSNSSVDYQDCKLLRNSKLTQQTGVMTWSAKIILFMEPIVGFLKQQPSPFLIKHSPQLGEDFRHGYTA